MKRIMSTLFILIGSLSTADAEPLQHHVRLGDFDQTHQLFSFREGLITVEPRAKVPLAVDFFLELPHGLGTNNPQLDRAFTGRGALIDLGRTSFKTKIQVPMMGFKPALRPQEIIPGHTYLVRLGAGDSYGQLHVLNIDFEKSVLDFTWCLADHMLDDLLFFNLSACLGRT